MYYVQWAFESLAMGVANLQKNKTPLVLTALILTSIYFIAGSYDGTEQISEPEVRLNISTSATDRQNVNEWLTNRANSMKHLSILGQILFLDRPEPKIENSSKTYQILVWKYGPAIENRHRKHFSGKRIDPFEYCSVKNCNITYSDDDVKTADIVIFHLHRVKGVHDIPKERNPDQIWAFLTDESPYHTFMGSKNKLKDFNHLFNWSMSYRSDADIPVPYGRTILRKPPIIQEDPFHNKRRDVLVAILGSNCGGQNHRWKYVAELRKSIPVDVYGGCGTTLKKECPGHFGSDCPAINDYLFYLSFENSNCDEYITEKLWWNAYQKYSIPIVMGSSLDTYRRLLPVDSYLHVDQFANPKVLADYLRELNSTGEYRRFHRWRNHFEVLNEHGYFKSRSYHYCRICEALNYNTKEKKVYDDLENFWSVKRDCRPAWDKQEDD